MNLQNRMMDDRFACFSKPRPTDITETQWNAAKDHASKSGQKLPKEAEQSAFYFYYMGESLQDVAVKLSLPLPTLVYTALYFDWPDRRMMLNSVRAGVKVKRADAAAIDLITDALTVTAALYKTKLAEVVKNPAAADKCPLIPKNFKELEILLKMLQSLQTDSPPIDDKRGVPAINVNIANLSRGADDRSESMVTVSEPRTVELPEQSSVQALPAELNETAKTLEMLQLLEKVKRSY